MDEKQKKIYKEKLTPDQYNVCILGNTEAPFSGKYWNNHEDGMYYCAVCNTPLFSSETKFESGTGWPSFWDVVEKENIESKVDDSYNMIRTEVVCKVCGSHIGHVFEDGPEPTRKRYCVNSAALNFKKKGAK